MANELEESFQKYQRREPDWAENLEGLQHKKTAWINLIAKVDNLSEKEARRKAQKIEGRTIKVRKLIYKYYNEAMKEVYENQEKQRRMKIIENIQRPVSEKPVIPITGISENDRLREENARLKSENKELIGILKEYRTRLTTTTSRVSNLEEIVKDLQKERKR